MSRRIGWALVALAVFGAAVWVRWLHLPISSALGDAVGPWWVAARGGLAPTPHAPPYGQLLAVPYRLILPAVSSLWMAQSALFVCHALVAPLVSLTVLALRGRWDAALIAGLAAAFSPGLIDTAVSGAETYLAPVWVAAMMLSVVMKRPGIAGLCWLGAVHNHPLALVLAPMLGALPLRRASWPLGVGLVLVGCQVWALAHEPVGVGGAGEFDSSVALTGWFETEGRMAGFALAGLVCGVLGRRTRWLAAAATASVLCLLLSGAALGYLRDHHLRLVVPVALVGIASLRLPRVGGRGAWLLVPFFIVPSSPVSRPSQARRPGTHGLLAEVSSSLADLERRPLVVDGVWISSSPAVEPGAAILDLALREPGAIDVGGDIALIVSAERDDLLAVPSGLSEVTRGDRHVVLVGAEAEVRTWLTAVCAQRLARGHAVPRIGGAFDGLVPLRPNITAARVAEWTDGCRLPK